MVAEEQLRADAEAMAGTGRSPADGNDALVANAVEIGALNAGWRTTSASRAMPAAVWLVSTVRPEVVLSMLAATPRRTPMRPDLRLAGDIARGGDSPMAEREDGETALPMGLVSLPARVTRMRRGRAATCLQRSRTFRPLLSVKVLRRADRRRWRAGGGGVLRHFARSRTAGIWATIFTLASVLAGLRGTSLSTFLPGTQ